MSSKRRGSASSDYSRSDFTAARVSQAASIDDWLGSLDGVAYLAAPDGTMIGVGWEGWNTFERLTGAACTPPQSVIGRSLFEMIAGDEVKAASLALHQRVASLAKAALTYEYRCDSPALERRMKMSISALTSKGRLLGVLYQSTLLSAADRVPLEFLDNSEAVREARRLADLPFVKICQFCAKCDHQALERRMGEARRFLSSWRRGGPTQPRHLPGLRTHAP